MSSAKLQTKMSILSYVRITIRGKVELYIIIGNLG